MEWYFVGNYLLPEDKEIVVNKLPCNQICSVPLHSNDWNVKINRITPPKSAFALKENMKAAVVLENTFAS
jgi:hypothetical protein